MSKRNSKRKNRKIKFSETSYVEKNYMRIGKAYIPIEIEDFADVYMKHDYLQTELSDEICSYIEEIAYMIPINTDIVLEIHTKTLTIEQQERIRKSIKNNYGIEIDDIDYDNSLLDKKSLIMLLFGLGALVINILISKFINEFISEFFSIIWWVAIWNLIEEQTLDKNENNWKRLSYQQLYDAKIEFVLEEESKNI